MAGNCKAAAGHPAYKHKLSQGEAQQMANRATEFYGLDWVEVIYRNRKTYRKRGTFFTPNGRNTFHHRTALYPQGQNAGVLLHELAHHAGVSRPAVRTACPDPMSQMFLKRIRSAGWSPHGPEFKFLQARMLWWYDKYVRGLGWKAQLEMGKMRADLLGQKKTRDVERLREATARILHDRGRP
jgi:hypothetical protein